jgi:hypothetical protein
MFHSSSAIILAPSSFQDDTTPPAFAGLENVTPDPNGSFLLDWLAAVDPTTPIEYVVYAAKGVKTAAQLFIPANKTVITETLTERLVYHGVAKEYFIKNNAYTFGVPSKRWDRKY